MHNYSNILVLTASFCLTFTLALAWCLVGVRSTEVMKKIFPSFQYLLKSHIDYLMMTGLLMVFFLLFSHFQTSPSLVVVISMCVGSVVNPAGFMMLAIKPNLSQKPTSPFGMVMLCSFSLATIGYAGAAWSVGYAAILSL